MTKIDNRQLKQLIIRKCGLICVIFLFTLLSFYSQGNEKLNQSKDVLNQPEVNSNEENSFYFLTSEQQRETAGGLGEIDRKVINPLNFKVQNLINEDQSLLRSNLRKKLSTRISKKINRFIDNEIKSEPNNLLRSKRESKSNKQHDSTNKNQQKNNQGNKQKKSNQNNSQNNQQNKQGKMTTNKPANRQDKATTQNKNSNNHRSQSPNKNKNKGGKMRKKRNDEDEEEEELPKISKQENKPKTDEEDDESVKKEDESKTKIDEDEEEEKETKKEEEEEEKKPETEEERKKEEEEKEEKEEEKQEEKLEDKERKELQNKGKSEEEINRQILMDRKMREAEKRKLSLNEDGEFCTPNAYKEFPPDLFGHKLRKRGFIIVHILVTCYMFFCLAVVCDHYFLPSLELCSTKLGLSNDVAGATFMAAGSSAPELFAAILGVFIAKSDVGTGTIVGSAIFNILFVIGLCGVCASSLQLSWWPIARDSSYYTLTVLVLIIVAYDGQVSTLESSIMILLYVGYIVTMHFNVKIYEFVLAKINQYTTSEFSEKIMNLDSSKNKLGNLGKLNYRSFQEEAFNLPNVTNILPPSEHLNKTSMFEAANHVIIQHRRLFRPLTRFRAAADLIIIQNRKIKISQYQPKNLASLSRQESVISKRKISLTEDIEDYWRTMPNYHELGPLLYAKWFAISPLYAALHYTIPNCKKNHSMFLATFLVSIVWIALFSYLMVWMVTLIGYTFGISDAIMGITLLAAGTSVPDAYTSLHVAKMGEGDMAVSNSIGSNVFDILVGLALPFFIETTLVSPGTNATINSKGLFYAMILLLLSLVVTVYLFYMNQWVLNKKLGIMMIVAYFVILLFCAILEFNIIDVKNPIMCDD